MKKLCGIARNLIVQHTSEKGPIAGAEIVLKLVEPKPVSAIGDELEFTAFRFYADRKALVQLYLTLQTYAEEIERAFENTFTEHETKIIFKAMDSLPETDDLAENGRIMALKAKLHDLLDEGDDE